MSYISESDTRPRLSMNLAPMIDFLFLMLVFFASLAVSRVTTRDTEIQLVQVTEQASSSEIQAPQALVHIAINANNEYKWVTELRDYPLTKPDEISAELESQHAQGLLPQDKTQTQVLLRIDTKASWDSVLNALFAVRKAGFSARPLYEPKEEARV